MNPKVQIAAGLAALLLGLLLGLVPGGPSGVTCGSPWVRDTAMIDAADRGSRLGADLIGLGREYESTSYRTQCADALDGRGTFGGVLAALGVLALLGVALVNSKQTTGPSEG